MCVPASKHIMLLLSSEEQYCVALCFTISLISFDSFAAGHDIQQETMFSEVWHFILYFIYSISAFWPGTFIQGDN